ncbi:MAG: PQQ-dependent sugar dehydrogenase [Porticoccaceae bacterium]
MIKKLALTLSLIIAIITGIIAIKSPGGLGGFWVILSSITGLNTTEPPADISGSTFQLPPGFSVNLYAEDLMAPRFLVPTETDDIIVSSTSEGTIKLLRDLDADGSAEIATVLIAELKAPQGLVFDGEWLYFSERDKVSKVRYNHQSGTLIGEPQLIIGDLPYGHPYQTHNTKTIGISPDRKLYITVGSPCNICEPEDPRYSAILRAELDGSGLEIYASGLRNSIGFDWAPWSGELFATVNARDLLGDNFPPDELNRVVQDGFYGWPYFNGDNIPDPDYGDKRPDLLGSAIPPTFKFRAHNAPLGIHFLSNTALLPDNFNKSALVALHGSWNRSELDGYKVVALHWDRDGNISSSDFMSGFLSEAGISGRPVDITQDRKGNLYISDDLADRVYRVTFRSTR